MGRISLDDMDNYGMVNSGSFFQLKDDRDNAKVRFLYGDISEITPYVVHEVETGEYDSKGNPKTKYINCLRTYDEPIDKCPLCKAGYRVTPKLFLKLYNEDAGECQVWERGKTYGQRIANLAAHFNPLYNRLIEITRLGAKGDKQTKYEFLTLDDSPININDEMYQCDDLISKLVVEKTADEMNEYLQVGSFASESVNVAQQRSDITRRTPNNNPPSRRAF